jgi:hypothetical protein
MALPLILAGPVLRRVEPRSATVWVALRESAQVGLSLFDSIANGGSGGGLFSGPAPAFESGPVATLRVCDKLHRPGPKDPQKYPAACPESASPAGGAAGVRGIDRT